ncbi:unnamed protein product [Paramecium octaurelia]|uniref:Uncharacterized protein n=1 Tax=Paramecium octaurelia TaxID=43137 RepID=A0A8S1W904_PAROT|nr:unnamed protein product [Paramecium octaurelia]
MILVHYYQLNIFNIVLIFIGNKQLVDKQLLVKSYTDKFQDVYESDQNKLSKGSNALELKKLVKVIPNKLILDLTNAKLIMSLDSVQDHPNLNKLIKVLKIQKLFVLEETCLTSRLRKINSGKRCRINIFINHYSHSQLPCSGDILLRHQTRTFFIPRQNPITQQN